MLKAKTKQAQLAMANFCRYGGEEPTDIGVTPNRLKHYRRLVYNVFYGTLEQAFPIAFAALDKEQWKTLVDDFVALHQPQTPEVWKLPKEFVDFVTQQDYAKQFNLPALNELLYFEWLEILVYSKEDVEIEENNNANMQLDFPIRLSPYAIICRLNYPIHKLSLSDAQKQPGQHVVVVYRNLSSLQVEFLDVSLFTAACLKQIKSDQVLKKSWLQQFCETNGIAFDTAIENEANNLLQQLRAKSILV